MEWVSEMDFFFSKTVHSTRCSLTCRAGVHRWRRSTGELDMLKLALVTVETGPTRSEVPAYISLRGPHSHVELISPPVAALASTLRLLQASFLTSFINMSCSFTHSIVKPILGEGESQRVPPSPSPLSSDINTVTRSLHTVSVPNFSYNIQYTYTAGSEMFHYTHNIRMCNGHIHRTVPGR